MKKNFFIILLTMIIGSIGMNLRAVTAYPYPVKFTQPDKHTIVTLTMKGDEKVKWAETEDGYSLIYNSEGYFCYAILDESKNMVPSQYIATEISERSAEVISFLEQTPKHLHYSDNQIHQLISLWDFVDVQVKNAQKSASGAVVGTLKLPAILMSFTDKTFTKDSAAFANLLNQTRLGISSVADYYKENSYGQLNLEFVIAGPYTTRYGYAYYGSNSNGNYQAFAREAATAAAADLDYSQFDYDNDGYVDGIHIFFAGCGEEAGGGADCIWSHRSVISSNLAFNGKIIRNYSCSPELSGSSGSTLTNVGVVCHELGHVFGAPDYYDTDYSSSGGDYCGTGKWDIMSSGSWNGNGKYPAHHNPYTKCNIYGWATINQLNSPTSVVAMNAENDANSFYRFNTTTNNEYYLLEARFKTGFDSQLPGSGLIIYHVHANFSPSSQSNNTSHPQRFYVVASSASVATPTSSTNSYGNINASAAAWPNSKNAFTDTTTPSAKSWAGNNTNKPITNIVSTTRNKSVSFIFCGAEANPGNVKALPIDSKNIKITWNLFNYKQVLLVYSENGVFGPLSANGTYNAGDNITGGGTVLYHGYGTSCTHSGLTPETLYRYKIYTWLDSVWTSGLGFSATTPHDAYSMTYTENFDADTLIPAFWNDTAESENFTWKIGRGFGTSSYAHSGENNYYCTTSDENYSGYESTLISAPVNTSTASSANISFWYLNPRRLLKQDVLIVKCRKNLLDDWTILGTYNTHVSAWTKLSLNLPSASFCQVAFVAQTHLGKGIAIDDISIQAGPASINTASADNICTKIFPNPTNSQVTIASSGNDQTIDYEIYDMMGRNFAKGSIPPENQVVISVKKWKSGVYIIKLHSENSEKIQQLIVK